MLIIFLIVVAIALSVYAVLLYNRLVRLRFLIKEAYSGIDVQLKLRHDLLPKVVDLVEGYSDYERSLMEKVTSMRSLLDPAQLANDKIKTENEFSGVLKGVLALAEAYPNLKASENFLELQKTISEIEDTIQMARRYYNGTVRDYNVMVTQFPSNLIATAFKFFPEHFFEVEYATERKSPDVKFI